MGKKVYVIGMGRVGSSFAFELNDIGYEIKFITDRNPDKLMTFASELDTPASSSKIDMEYLAGSDLIIICVQDRFIKHVLETIAGFDLNLKDKYFFHTSGSETTDVFSVLNSPVACVSIHPIQTFDKISENNENLLKNIYFGVEGNKEGLKLAFEIIKKLDSKFIEIPKDKKILYHSACVVSSNFLVTLLNITSEIIGNIGIEKSNTYEIFRPLIENTLKNISKDGLVQSLTGPFERNDIETITNHLKSIHKELPSLIPFYTLLGMETVKIAFKKETLNLKNVISILDLMNEYILNEVTPGEMKRDYNKN